MATKKPFWQQGRRDPKRIRDNVTRRYFRQHYARARSILRQRDIHMLETFRALAVQRAVVHGDTTMQAAVDAAYRRSAARSGDRLAMRAYFHSACPAEAWPHVLKGMMKGAK